MLVLSDGLGLSVKLRKSGEIYGQYQLNQKRQHFVPQAQAEARERQEAGVTSDGAGGRGHRKTLLHGAVPDRSEGEALKVASERSGNLASSLPPPPNTAHLALQIPPQHQSLAGLQYPPNHSHPRRQWALAPRRDPPSVRSVGESACFTLLPPSTCASVATNQDRAPAR